MGMQIPLPLAQYLRQTLGEKHRASRPVPGELTAVRRRPGTLEHVGSKLPLHSSCEQTVEHRHCASEDLCGTCEEEPSGPADLPSGPGWVSAFGFLGAAAGKEDLT